MYIFWNRWVNGIGCLMMDNEVPFEGIVLKLVTKLLPSGPNPLILPWELLAEVVMGTKSGKRDRGLEAVMAEALGQPPSIGTCWFFLSENT